jgi:hypothetical protein
MTAVARAGARAAMLAAGFATVGCGQLLELDGYRFTARPPVRVLEELCPTDGGGQADAGCPPEACAGADCDACVPGTSTCMGSTLRRCSAGGRWDTSEVCSDDLPVCDPTLARCTCAEGALQCTSSTEERLCVDGNIQVTACPPGALCQGDRCRARAWARQFGSIEDDAVSGLALDAASNPIIVGTTNGALPGQAQSGPRDRFIEKYDPTGAELWTRQLALGEDAPSPSVSTDGSGNIIVVGALFVGSVTVASVSKYDSSGGEAWTRQFGPDYPDGDYSGRFISANASSSDAQGAILVAGQTAFALPGQENAIPPSESFFGIQVSALVEDAYVRKYDAGGGELWTRQFGSERQDAALSVSAGADGGVVVCGSGALPQHTSSGDVDAFVLAFDGDGNVLWSRQFGTTGADSATAVSVAPNGATVVAATSGGTVPEEPDAGVREASVRAYDTQGTELWARSLGSIAEGATSAPRLATDRDGNVIVALVANDRGVHLLRMYDATGTELWSRELESADPGAAVFLAVDAAGSLLVAGSTRGALPGQTGAGKSDAFLLKIVD